MKTESVAELIEELTAKLAALTDEYAVRIAHASDPSTGGVEPTDSALVEEAIAVMAERRMRREFLPEEIFHDPAWNILLALFASGAERTPMTVKDVVLQSDAPATTSQRWIDQLHDLNLIDRSTDKEDRRRVKVSLSQSGSNAMKSYFRAVIKRYQAPRGPTGSTTP